VKFVDLDMRLIALNDDANKAAAWSPSDAKWRETTDDFAGRAWADGRSLTQAEAKQRFPKADLDAIPAL
jgi:hypothetical protein